MNTTRAIYIGNRFSRNKFTGDYNAETWQFFPDGMPNFNFFTNPEFVYLPHDCNDWDGHEANKRVCD